MRTFATFLSMAVLLCVPVQAQEEPEAKTGSRLLEKPEPMKTRPGSYDTDKTRELAKRFGNCLFDRRTSQSIKLLTVSDYWSIDYTNLGDAEYLLKNRTLMEKCLGRVGRIGTSGIGMRISNMAIRAALTEAAYLNEYGEKSTPIKIGPDDPEFLPNRYYVSGETSEKARAAASMSDCVVYQAPAKAHAIVHTKPASSEEMNAVKEIVPAIGRCIPAGKQMKLDVESIRSFVAEGLWARSYYGSKLKETKGAD